MIVIIFQLKSQVTLAGVRFMDRFNNNISAILNDPYNVKSVWGK